MTAITLGSVTIKLRQPHDFVWLARLGEPFCAFDQQDSGNVCFGVERAGRHFFIKYAGAQTMHFAGDVGKAIERLKTAEGTYRALQHQSLVPLLESFAAGDGHALVFEWFGGESLHPHWQYPPPEKYTNPKSPFFRFRQLPLRARLDALDSIFDFHTEVERRGFVAVDFYDGSVMYDFQTGQTRICDIDLYRPGPFVNLMGRLWGSSRFMAPEEFCRGARIDHATNAFTMGATAFCLLGGETDRSPGKWDAGHSLYQVARRATQDNREDRFKCVGDFYQAWQAALANSPA